MMRLFAVSLLFVLLSGAPSRAAPTDYSMLFRDFDANGLTVADKRFLQTALAFEGFYNGLLDGEWGRISRAGLTKYSLREFGTNSQDWHMAMLAFAYFQRIEKDGWAISFLDALSISVLTPDKATAVEAPSERFANWRHTGSTLKYSVSKSDTETASGFHRFTAERHRGREALYTVRKPNFAVTRARLADGSILYSRSDRIGGAWSTIMLSAKNWDEPTLNAVSASISVGRAAPIMFTEGGRLHDAILRVLQAVEQEQESQQKAADGRRNPPEPEPEQRSGSGSGFFVSAQGHVLTNAHVVENCAKITVDGSPAVLVTTSDAFDLALLKTSSADERAFALFSDTPAKLNSDVTVVGYPYARLLGGLNVTRGSVSALKGMGGEATQMQITAPIQSGNSGGPVIASDGEVVGVVVSTLDAVKLANVIGDIPQNVNFAVRGEIAKLFLSQNGLTPKIGKSDVDLDPVALAESASKITAFIECH